MTTSAPTYARDVNGSNEYFVDRPPVTNFRGRPGGLFYKSAQTPQPILDEVAPAWNDYGLSGSGLTVAVIDSGVFSEHIDFENRIIPGLNFAYTKKKDKKLTHDAHGHGSHVSGIIAANGIHRGVAPGAQILPLKVIYDSSGTTSTGILSYALKWVLKNYKRYNITAVNLSIGDSENFKTFRPDMDPYETEMRSQIAELHALNIPVVIAAGNAYATHARRNLFPDNEGIGHEIEVQGMAFPGITPEAISVGALFLQSLASGRIYPNGAAYARAVGREQITPYSQRLTSLPENPSFYTDLFSYGSIITSTGIKNEDGQSDPTSSADNEGTSMATPMVTGMVLLLQEEYLRLHGRLPTVEQLTTWLKSDRRADSATVFDGKFPYFNPANSQWINVDNDYEVNTNAAYPRADVVAGLAEMNAIRSSEAFLPIRTIKMKLNQGKTGLISGVISGSLAMDSNEVGSGSSIQLKLRNQVLNFTLDARGTGNTNGAKLRTGYSAKSPGFMNFTVQLKNLPLDLTLSSNELLRFQLQVRDKSFQTWRYLEKKTKKSTSQYLTL